MSVAVEIVEVGPRDGFQAIGPFIPTGEKVAIVRALHAAGLRRMEVGSFTSAKAIPQLADTEMLLRETADLEDFDPQVLVPTERRAAQALEAGSVHLSFVLSVSPSHNRNNVRRDPSESIEEYVRLAASLPKGVAMRLNLATAFDCPFEGRTPPEATLDVLRRVVDAMPGAEVALCDTTGRVTPDHVGLLFREAATMMPEGGRLNFHAHDTYGLGVANALAALSAGVRSFDASIAGLGGCPFAPGATGNVATEDMLWTFERMGIGTGVRLPEVLAVANRAAALPGACRGGRVRDAANASERLRQGIAA